MYRDDRQPDLRESRLRQRGALVAVLAALCLTACGGGGGDGGGGGGSSACERVSAGPTDIVIRNQLSTGVRAFFSELAFGSDMLAGECNTVGFDAGNRPTIRLELQQCSNVPTNSDCTGLLFGPTRTVNVPVTPGNSHNVVVDAATFR
jgi:hypothetical protein